MKSFLLKKNGPPSPSIIKNQEGFALLLSLLIIFLLVVVILETDFQVRADLRAAGNFRDDLKAYYLARSAISAGKALIKDDSKNSNRYDSLMELWAFPIPDYPVGDGVISGLIVDEERKIHLNKLVIPPTSTGIQQSVDDGRKNVLKRLFELLKVNPELVDPIIDWIDEDDQPLPFGAESGDYQECDPPYCPRNGPFETLEELRMVNGITEEIYRKISPYLTLYGDGKINVNTADTIILQSFDAGIDETDADTIIGKRPFDRVLGTTSGAFENHVSKQLSDVHSRMFNDRIYDWITIRSDYFFLTANGRVNNTRKTVFAVIERNGKLHYFRMD